MAAPAEIVGNGIIEIPRQRCVAELGQVVGVGAGQVVAGNAGNEFRAVMGRIKSGESGKGKKVQYGAEKNKQDNFGNQWTGHVLFKLFNVYFVHGVTVFHPWSVVEPVWLS